MSCQNQKQKNISVKKKIESQEIIDTIYTRSLQNFDK